MDLLTIVYVEELSLLEIQLSSLALHAEPGAIETLAIVVNEVDPETRALCRRSVEAIVREASLPTTRVKIMDLQDLAVPSTDAGYVNQQVIKLAYAAVAPSPSYVVLDAKNMALRPISRSTHYAGDGRPLLNFMTYVDDYQRYMIDYFYDLSCVAVDRRIYHLPAMMTPFALHRSVCIELMETFAARCGEPFAAFFAHREHFSEFLLYATHLVANGADFDTLYDPAPQSCLTIWPETHTDVDFFRILPALCKPYAYLAFHRRKLLALGVSERGALVAFLRSRGLRCDRLESTFAALEA